MLSIWSILSTNLEARENGKRKGTMPWALPAYPLTSVVVAPNVCSPFVLTEQQFREKRGRKYP